MRRALRRRVLALCVLPTLEPLLALPDAPSLATVCTFTCGSALLTISTAFNALSLHAICTAAWVAIAAVIAFPFASLRTFGNLKWLGYVAVVSILVSIFTVVIAVGLADRPALAPPAPEPFDLGVRAFGSPSFAEGMSAVSSIFFAFTGTSSLCVPLPLSNDPARR